MIKALYARKLSIIGLGLAGVVFLSAMALVAYSTVELSRFSHAETQRAVFIHSAGQALEPGVSVRPIDLAGTLARLKYAETGRPRPRPGSTAARAASGTSTSARRRRASDSRSGTSASPA